MTIMITISGYLADYDQEIVDGQNAIAVNSCGHYQLVKRDRFETVRPTGRKDFQLIYVARGVVNCTALNKRYTLTEGMALLYFPDEPQQYEYARIDNPEVYWIHFSGVKVKEILENAGLFLDRIYRVGVKSDYVILFDKIIGELQIKRKNYFELCNSYLMELLLRMSRHVSEKEVPAYQRNEQIEQAVQLLHQNFNNDLQIQQYAQQCNVSTCWFIRSFRERMGMTPQKYLTAIRINKAKELLRSSSYNISEIAAVVGYQNPLYFSRIFKKCTGCSPMAYKQNGERV